MAKKFVELEVEFEVPRGTSFEMTNEIILKVRDLGGTVYGSPKSRDTFLIRCASGKKNEIKNAVQEIIETCKE